MLCDRFCKRKKELLRPVESFAAVGVGGYGRTGAIACLHKSWIVGYGAEKKYLHGS